MPRDLIKYAKDDEDSIKRWSHPSGSLKVIKQERENSMAMLHALYRLHTDAVLYEIERQEREAEALKRQLSKVRAEIRKRRKQGGYVGLKKGEKPVEVAPLTVDTVKATTDYWHVSSPLPGPNPCSEVYSKPEPVSFKVPKYIDNVNHDLTVWKLYKTK